MSLDSAKVPTLSKCLGAAHLLIAALAYLVVQLPEGLGGSGRALFGGLLGLNALGLWWSGRNDASLRDFHFVVGAASILLVAPISVAEVHDVQRYLWDGALAASGVDPYRVAPNDLAAETLRAIWPTPEEHAEYVTLYPPGAVALFAFASLGGIAGAPWIWKGLVVCAALGALALAKRKLTSKSEALLFLSPLLTFEVALGTHLDVLVGAVCLLAFVAVEDRRYFVGGLLVGLGVLLKFVPALMMIPFLMRASWRGRRRLAFASVAAVVAGYGLAFMLDFVPLGSVPVFFEKWRFGAPAFSLLEHFCEDDALLISAAIGGVLIAMLMWWSARFPNDARVYAWALALPFVAAPVVFPWYLVPAALLLGVRSSGWLLGWVVAAPLTYEVVDRFEIDGSWEPATWPLVGIAMSILLGFALERLAQNQSAKRTSTR